MTERTLLIDSSAGVAVITIDRPEVRNAISCEVRSDLRDALAQLQSDDTVGAVVLTGAGGHAFAAGADIIGLRDYTFDTALEADLQRLCNEIEDFSKPTIAAVNGYALGGGCELALACDIRIGGKQARFGLPETALGILPGGGGTQRLARLVGSGRAMELILTGRLIEAIEAQSIGLISSVADDPVLAACETARGILARGPLAVRLAKLVLSASADTGQHSGMMIERLAQALLYESDDKREGVEAFLGKRIPGFTGR